MKRLNECTINEYFYILSNGQFMPFNRDDIKTLNDYELNIFYIKIMKAKCDDVEWARTKKLIELEMAYRGVKIPLEKDMDAFQESLLMALNRLKIQEKWNKNLTNII